MIDPDRGQGSHASGLMANKRNPFPFHTQAWADALARQPGNQVHALETGHWVMSRRPEQFNQIVDAWLPTAK